jgi:hypothetical protein
MENEKKIRRDPQPALIAPTGHRYLPLYCATQWIATAGHSVDWDVVADELWHQAYRALCDAIASEEVKIICHSACNIGSDSLLMKFKRRLALVSQGNQHDAASPTSVGPSPSRV